MYGTDIFLAGAEVDILTDSLMDNGTPYILMSFFYLWDFDRIAGVHAAMDANPGRVWMLDSGAYTYAMQYKIKKGTKFELPSPDEYVKLYFQYLDEHGERWARCAEPDLDWVEGLDVSTEKVTEWREEMLTSWSHYDVMPVYHRSRGEDEWQRWCNDDRIRALAMGSSYASSTVGASRRMVLYAQDRGKGVHGFGCTRINTTLKYVPYDWVDSTSVWAGQQYGTMYVFLPQGALGKFVVIRDRQARRSFYNHFKEIGCNPDLIFADRGPGSPTEVVAEIRKANVLAWSNLAKRMHRLKMTRDEMRAKIRAMGFSKALPREAVQVLSTREGENFRPVRTSRMPVVVPASQGRVPTQVREPRQPSFTRSRPCDGDVVDGGETPKPRMVGRLFGVRKE